MTHEFNRIKRLPPYVFNITSELKMAARHRGEDIIDLSMGNPDGATPPHIEFRSNVENVRRQTFYAVEFMRHVDKTKEEFVLY